MHKIVSRVWSHRWLIAALVVASCYSAMALRLAFATPDLVQDDARQHVFWMARFQDPALFPNDLIADYFQAVAPAGYKALYWIFAKLGLGPLLLSRTLPAAIGIATAFFAFRLFVRLTADRRGAFFASVLICQLIWFKDDVISATPRAFVYPLFLAFLLCLVERRLVFCLFILALEGLVYPQAAFVSTGVLMLQLVRWQDRQVRFSNAGADYVVAIGGVCLLAAVLLPFAQTVSPYGPVITREAAAALPEFGPHGRSQFFTRGISFWLTSGRAGLWPGAIPIHVIFLAAAGVFILFTSKLPAVSAALFARVAAAAVGLWAAAHLLLFKLHLPARYSQWVLRILVALLAAAALAALFNALETKLNRSARLFSALLLIIIAPLTLWPIFSRNFPHHSYVAGQPRALFDFLRAQPKDVVIATLRESASKIPVFAHRSVLVSAEHAIPYHQGYYRIVRERGQDMVRAFLTTNADDLRSFIDKYHVDLIVVGRRPVTAGAIEELRWFREIAPRAELATHPQTALPVLATLADSCRVWQDEGNIVLDAHLITLKIATHASTP